MGLRFRGRLSRLHNRQRLATYHGRDKRNERRITMADKQELVLRRLEAALRARRESTCAWGEQYWQGVVSALQRERDRLIKEPR
jgi:hypothetical protein